jgi:hypothetical protein
MFEKNQLVKLWLSKTLYERSSRLKEHLLDPVAIDTGGVEGRGA